MNMTPMQLPLTRAEFERRFNLLRESVEGGRFHIGNCSKTIESLLKIRMLPNKRLDLLTVDEGARLTANMMVNSPFSESEEDPEN